MKKPAKPTDLISILDWRTEELRQLISMAVRMKENLKQAAAPGAPELAGRTLGMIFQKPSTRTSVSFAVAMYQLGGQALMLNAQDLQLKRGETIGDTARTLSRYLDAIMIRTFNHQDVVDLAEAATVPVINGLTDLLHPCQALGDVLTIVEVVKRGAKAQVPSLEGLKIAYVGDGNNVANSLVEAAARFGGDLWLAGPEGYEADPGILARASSEGANVHQTHDPREAAREADILYTDVWASMGKDEEQSQRASIFRPFQVNKPLLDLAKRSCRVMHCLPAHRGDEITDEVMDGPNSVVFDQAENRMHIQKAILATLIRGGGAA